MAQDGNPRRVSLVFPIILITVGALFLLHNWRPAFDPWPILTTYWPLILIFVGVGKIWDSTYRSCNPNAPQGISIGATIGALAFVIVLVALLVHGRSFTRRHGLYSGTQHNAQTVDLQGAKSARARLEMGAGQLTINGGANHVLDADFTYDSSFTHLAWTTTWTAASANSTFRRIHTPSTSAVLKTTGFCASAKTSH